MTPHGSLSRWERVRVRASGLCLHHALFTAAALTPALSQREREEYIL